MCDGKNMLDTMKVLQIKPEPVKCTCTNSCWCSELSFRFPVSQISGDCMSPKELMDTHGSEMNDRDIHYLEGLVDREFIPN